MLKFREIGTYKNAVNIGNMTADVVLHNGMVVTYDRATEKAAFPATGKESGLAIVLNTIDKPETLNPNDFTIEVGENPRLFTLASLAGRVIDMDMDQIKGKYSDVAEGKFLVAGKDGKLSVVADATGYEEYFKVLNKTGFNGEGIAVEVVA